MPGYVKHPHNTGGNFLKIEAGVPVTVRILDEEPVEHMSHWFNNHSEVCGDQDCTMCAQGDRPRVRWSLSADAGAGKQTWEMSDQVCAQLEEIAEMRGSLLNLRLQVKRSGAGRNTRYTLIALPDAGAASPDPTRTQDMAQYVRDLCANLGRNPRDELVEFLANVRPDLADAPAEQALEVFVTYLDDFGPPKKETKSTNVNAQHLMDMMY